MTGAGDDPVRATPFRSRGAALAAGTAFVAFAVLLLYRALSARDGETARAFGDFAMSALVFGIATICYVFFLERPAGPPAPATPGLQHFGASAARLRAAIDAAQRNGRAFALLGTAIASVAILVLWYDVRSGAPHYLTLAGTVFLELVAFFFLRLFRASLDSVGYFHNELTNVEARDAAIALLERRPGPHADAVIKTLLETERNRILGRGQTTVELERQRRDQELVGTLLAALRAGAAPASSAPER